MKIYKWTGYVSQNYNQYIFILDKSLLKIGYNGNKSYAPKGQCAFTSYHLWQEITDIQEINLIKMKYL